MSKFSHHKPKLKFNLVKKNHPCSAYLKTFLQYFKKKPTWTFIGGPMAPTYVKGLVGWKEVEWASKAGTRWMSITAAVGVETHWLRKQAESLAFAAETEIQLRQRICHRPSILWNIDSMHNLRIIMHLIIHQSFSFFFFFSCPSSGILVPKCELWIKPEHDSEI